MEKIHGVTQNLLLCPECEYQSPYQSNFLNHLVQAHECHISEVNDVDVYRVTIEEGVPLIRSSTKSHKNQLRNYQNTNGEYGCSRCDYTYETIDLLEAHCKEGHGPQTWYLCPCSPFENRFLSGIRAHLFTKHKEIAASSTCNTEGRKIDKNRFQLYSHYNPTIKYMNRSKNSNGIENESPTKIVSLNLKSSIFGDKDIITNSNIECITITDD